MTKKYEVQLKCAAEVYLTHPTKGDKIILLRAGAFPEPCVKNYTDEGYTTVKMTLLTRGEYLNRRIQRVVDAINDNAEERRKLREEFRAGDMTIDQYMDGIKVTQEFEVFDLRKLYGLMNTLRREDLDCTVEEAIQLYDMVF